ncbi:saccharopine dehydrogenase C-terminal domain-containing protein [Bacteroidota bacterium]
MKTILILGAGRSTTALFKYLLDKSQDNDWCIVAADQRMESIKKIVGDHSRGIVEKINICDEAEREKLISRAHIVLSMVPARFHPLVAHTCLKLKKNLLTASYVTKDMEVLHTEAKASGILFLNECGLDPGIDHMSAMSVIDRIHNAGYKLKTFETYTGGLLAANNDETPWQYRFTWNPRNVVLAGQGGVKFLQEGRYKYIPYHKIFRRTEIIKVPGYGYFEGYANRDSLRYMDVYKLHNIETMFRGTLRRPGFCKAWDTFVQLGATDDSYKMQNVGEMTHRQFINSFLSYNPWDSVELKLAHYMNLDFDSQEMFKLRWLGIFDDEPVGLDGGSPANILEHILKKKWTLSAEDRDMIVMSHKFEYYKGKKVYGVTSNLVVIGEDQDHTAMAKTVGLPLGVATRLILNGKINIKGVAIPITPEIYGPILQELKLNGLNFSESKESIKKLSKNPSEAF